MKIFNTLKTSLTTAPGNALAGNLQTNSGLIVLNFVDFLPLMTNSLAKELHHALQEVEKMVIRCNEELEKEYGDH